MGMPIDKIPGIPSVTNQNYNKRKENGQNAETKNGEHNKEQSDGKNKQKRKTDTSRKVDLYI